MRKLLSALVACAALVCAQTAQFPGALATDNQLKTQSNRAQTTLSVTLGASDTTIVVGSATKFVAPSIITIDDKAGTSEIVAICAATANTLSVGASTGSCPNINGRAYDGSSAISHPAGGTVSAFITAWHHNAVTAEVKAIEAALGANLVNVLIPTPVTTTSGGTGTASAFTQGSIVFAGASGVYAQDNANYFWDNSAKRLSLKKAAADTGALWVGAGAPDPGTNGSTLNWSGAVSTASSTNPVAVTSAVNTVLQTGDTVYLQSCTGAWASFFGGPYTVTVTGLKTFTVPFDATGLPAYAANGCIWEYRNYMKTTPNGLVVADGTQSSPINSQAPTINISRFDTTDWGGVGAPYRMAYKHLGPVISQGTNTLYLESRESVAGSITGFTNVAVIDQVSPVYTVSNCTAANPTVCTTSVTHNLGDRVTLKFAGATGSWTPINNAVGFPITKLSATTFSIALDASGYGAFTGIVTGTVTQIAFPQNNVCQVLAAGTLNGCVGIESTVVNLTGNDAPVAGAGVPGLMVAFNAAMQGAAKGSAAYFVQGNAPAGGFINGLWFDVNSMSAGGYLIHGSAAAGAGGAALWPNDKWVSWRNAGASADIPVLKLTSGNNTLLNVNSGNVIALTTNSGALTLAQINTDGVFSLPQSTSSLSVAGQPRASATNSAVQSIPNAAFTSLTFDSNTFVAQSVHSTSVNPTRFTVPAAEGGIYQLTCALTFASNATGNRYIKWLRNGAAIIATDNKAAVNGDTTNMNLSVLASLAAADYVECQAYQNSGAALNTAAGAQLTYAVAAKLY